MNPLLLIAFVSFLSRSQVDDDVLGAVLTLDPEIHEEVGGVGLATVMVDSTRNNIVVTIALVDPSINVTSTHLHQMNAQARDPVVFDLRATAEAFVNGRSYANYAVPTALGTNLTANPSDYYIDIHSPQFGGGTIRGFLVVQARRRAVVGPRVQALVPGRGSLAAGVLLKITGDIERICTGTTRVNGELARLGSQHTRVTTPTYCHPTAIPFYCSTSVCTCIADNFDDALDLALAGACAYDSWQCDDFFRCSCRLEACTVNH